MTRLSAAIFVLLPAVAAPLASAETLVVRLENGTDKALGVQGAMVKLLLPDPSAEGGRRVVSETVGSGDSVRFELESTFAGKKASVIVSFKEATYFFDQAAEIGKAEAGPFKVFETTDDPSAIRVINHEVVLIPHRKSGRVLVGEQVHVINSTKRAYVGAKLDGSGERESLVFHLPEGAQDFEPEMAGTFISENIHRRGAYFGADVAIPPGQEVYTFRYRIPLGEDGLVFEKEVVLAAHRVTISMPADPTLVLSVGGFERDMDTGDVVVWAATNVDAGARVEIELRPSGGAVEDGEAEMPGHSWLWILGGFALGVTAVTLAWHRPNAASGAAAAGQRELRDFLVEEIARLDADREAGRVPEEYHGRKRQALKKRLLELG